MDVVRRVRGRLAEAGYIARTFWRSVPNAVHHRVSYFPQAARPEDVEPIVTKKLRAVNDPYWALTGASSPERYALWVRSACGMASTLMCIEYFKPNGLRLVELGEDALAHGVYQEDERGIGPMRFREYAQWVTKHGLHARPFSHLSLHTIQHALANGALAIVSVNPNIRGFATAPSRQKGGHLVLAVGYDTTKDMICIHNPSGFLSLGTQENHWLERETFLSHFSGRGILINETRLYA